MKSKTNVFHPQGPLNSIVKVHADTSYPGRSNVGSLRGSAKLYVYVSIYIYMHICINVYTYICRYINKYTYTYIHANVYIRITPYVYIGIYIYTYTYTRGIVLLNVHVIPHASWGIH